MYNLDDHMSLSWENVKKQLMQIFKADYWKHKNLLKACTNSFQGEREKNKEIK